MSAAPAFEFGPVTEADFAELVALRIDVMRESLERLGRFDPATATERFRSTFRPAGTRRIRVGGEAAGCVGYWAEGDAMRIEHFYLAKQFQRLGLGAAVLRRLFDEAPSQVTRFRVAALRESDSNRFYERHGFVKAAESEWDIEYERPNLPPIKGGCLCGAVRYEARPTHREGYYCHCRMCQLAFGNTRAAFINLRKDEVRWTAGAPTFYASSKFARRGFCGHCGSPLSFEYLVSERMDLSIGSLDDPAAITPISHFAVESRIANWHGDDGLPGQRIDEHVKLTERWQEAYGSDVSPGVDAVRKG